MSEIMYERGGNNRSHEGGADFRAGNPNLIPESEIIRAREAAAIAEEAKKLASVGTVGELEPLNDVDQVRVVAELVLFNRAEAMKQAA